MSQTTIDIERVVREVLAELGAVGDNGAQRPATAVAGDDAAILAPPQLPSRSVDSNDSADLVVDARVVTMNEVLGRLASVRRVVVSRGAIVTPAVRDELIRRGIALTHADSSNGRSAAPVRLVVITTGTDFEPAALAAGLVREGLKVECSASDCLISATDQLAAETAKPDTLGVLLTRHTAAGLCLANRLPGVRAVTGVDAPTVAAATAAVGANLLVADPQAGTFFQLKQMATEFCRCGVRPCPDVFRDRLA